MLDGRRGASNREVTVRPPLAAGDDVADALVARDRGDFLKGAIITNLVGGDGCSVVSGDEQELRFRESVKPHGILSAGGTLHRPVFLTGGKQHPEFISQAKAQRLAIDTL